MPNPYTLQEVFDLGWKRFVVDMQPFAFYNNCCRYRTASGPCIIGTVLPDDLADKFDQMANAVSPVMASQIATEHPDILSRETPPLVWDEAQYKLHDNLTTKDGKTQRQRASAYLAFAKRHNLKLPSLDGIDVGP